MAISGSRWRSRPNRPLTLTLTSTLAAATIGNSFISKEDLAWLQARRRPRMQISTSAFAVVGIAYYVIMGVVIYRSSDRRDSTTTRLALVVLVLNEVWNVAFFGGRSTRNRIRGHRTVSHPTLAAAAVPAPRPHVSGRSGAVHNMGALLRPSLDPSALAAQSDPDGMIPRGGATI
jgi:hypothetical protein